jgi:hypothetical protein
MIYVVARSVFEARTYAEDGLLLDPDDWSYLDPRDRDTAWLLIERPWSGVEVHALECYDLNADRILAAVDAQGAEIVDRERWQGRMAAAGLDGPVWFD